MGIDRTPLQIIEEPDIVPGISGGAWLPSFGGAFGTAVVQFSIRTLLRSRQHRVILAFYLGIGFAMTVSFIKSPAVRGQLAVISESDPWHKVNAPMLAASVVIMGFWIVGTRVVFALPLDLRANWVFRAAPLDGERGILAARRRALLAISVSGGDSPGCPRAVRYRAGGVLPARSAEDPVRVLVPAGKIEL